jgi:hypothetical protein
VENSSIIYGNVRKVLPKGDNSHKEIIFHLKNTIDEKN